MEHYIFDEIIFKNSKYKIYFDDHDEVKYTYNEVSRETIDAYIRKLISFLEYQLADFQYDLYKRKNGYVYKFEDYIVTGRTLANSIRKSKITISESNLVMLQLIFSKIVNDSS